MKKVLSIVLALVMCFALAMPAFATEATLPDINDDVTVTLPPVEDVTVPDFDLNGDVMAAIQEVLEKLGETEFGNFDEFNKAFRDALAGVIGEDAMNKITDIINSNAFLKWLASIYTGSVTEPDTTEAPETTEPTTEAPTEEPTTEEVVTPETGDSAVALAVFATVSVAAAAAFVCTKKKA